MLPAPPARRLWGLCLAAVATSTCLAACGTSDSDAIKGVVRNYIQAVLDDNGTAACALLTTDATKAFVQRVQRDVKTSDCSTAFTQEARRLSDDQKATYRSAVLDKITVTGDKAIAAVQFTGAQENIALQRVNGDWKIATGPTT